MLRQTAYGNFFNSGIESTIYVPVPVPDPAPDPVPVPVPAPKLAGDGLRLLEWRRLVLRGFMARILVVEDDDSLRQVLSMFLVKSNHDVTSASSGCLLYTSDAADDLPCVYLGGRRIIKKQKKQQITTFPLLNVHISYT